jgi:hypothetical protein
MDKAKRARTAETPKQPSLGLTLRAPYLYPDRAYSAVEQRAVRPGLGTLPLRHRFLLLRRHLGSCLHKSPRPALSPRRIAILPRSR